MKPKRKDIKRNRQTNQDEKGKRQRGGVSVSETSVDWLDEAVAVRQLSAGKVEAVCLSSCWCVSPEATTSLLSVPVSISVCIWVSLSLFNFLCICLSVCLFLINILASIPSASHSPPSSINLSHSTCQSLYSAGVYFHPSLPVYRPICV